MEKPNEFSKEFSQAKMEELTGVGDAMEEVKQDPEYTKEDMTRDFHMDPPGWEEGLEQDDDLKEMYTDIGGES
jgi:hypothetical protein